MNTSPGDTVTDLVTAGILRVAERPPGNRRDFVRAPFLTVPLIAEDYPAKTAAMWNAAYARFGMPDTNVMMVADPKDASLILDVFRRDRRYRGGGCGIGFKEVVLTYLDEAVPLARAIGAVNIIKKIPDGRLVGANTDGLGYAVALEKLFVRTRDESLGNQKVLILGAGGSARAIAFALAERRAELTILNRTEDRAQELAERLNRYFERIVAVAGGRSCIASALLRQDVVVSVVDDPTSPLDAYSTLGPMELPVTSQRITENLTASAALLNQAKPSLIVSDIRIRREPTAMLAQARAFGFETLDGIPMVINQGIDAFWWLYGEMPSLTGQAKTEVAAIMRQAAENS